MKDTEFTEMLNQLVKFQGLLKEGLPYDHAYYLTYNKHHEDFIREQQKEKKYEMPEMKEIFNVFKVFTDDYEKHHPEKKKVVIGSISGNTDGLADDKFVDEPHKNF